MRLLIEAVLVLIIVSLGLVVVFQQMHIASLESENEMLDRVTSVFSSDINDLKTRLTVACSFRNPVDDHPNINWTRVCR